MKRWSSFAFLICLSLLVFTLTATNSTLAGDDWLPIPPEELAMKDNPASPGSHAMILYREVFTDDTEAYERHYVRIKIFTEEGKRHADVEIPYFKELISPKDIKARTIRPDGSVVNFEGKPFEKTVIKGRGIKFLAKTFTLPDVQVGSIIEYKYRLVWDQYGLYSSRWILNDNLFTRRARFGLKPFRGQFALRWVHVNVPAGKMARQEKDGVIRLELENIPAFQNEEYMPPENELKSRVDFYYTRSDETNPQKFWKEQGKKLNEQVQNFVGHRKGVEQAVAQIVAPGDSPETKLRKLYARAQQVRNLSIERAKTEKEQKREKLKEAENVEDLLKRGYGDGEQITWLFLAFARAAGFEAWPVVVSRRNEYFFNPNNLDPRQLNDEVVLVRLDGKDLFLDPGSASCPFGLLPWSETGVTGLRLDKEGGTFVTTTLPSSSASRIERSATLQLGDSYALEGTLSLTYTGLEALRRRREARDEDDAGRRKLLEDEVKRWLPVGSTIELKSSPDWAGAEQPVHAEFSIRMPNWANSVGRRILMPVSLLAGSHERRFEHASRLYPVYFDFPFQTVDEVTLQLPLGFQVGSLPEPQNRETPFGRYQLSCQAQGGTLRFHRTLTSEGLLFPLQYYSGLRAFFENVRTGDEQQVVLQSAQAGKNP